MEANDIANSYVLGFLFDEDESQVVLIEKQKPKWQAGRLNGVGGKIKEGETYLEAMIREFEEETGVRHEGWTQFATMSSPNFNVACFKATSDDAISKVETKTEERIDVYPVNSLDQFHETGKTISNIKWLVSVALDESLVGADFHY